VFLKLRLNTRHSFFNLLPYPLTFFRTVKMIEENPLEIVGHGIDGLHLLAEAGDFWPEVEKALKEVLGLTVPVSIDHLARQNAGEVQCFVVAAVCPNSRALQD
jgi:hypothetical protein